MMKKYLLAIIVGAVLFFILETILRYINHYDFICFILTVIITTIIVAINKHITD